MRYRVIQWATGNVGRYALRGILEHPDYDLVGLCVHSDAKAGRDAAELCGLPGKSGVLATADPEAILGLDADVVSYNATADLRPMDAISDLARILASGKNAVSSSLPFLTYPPFANPSFKEPLEKACAEGGTSLFTSAIDPGFANDLLPMVLMGICERVESVRIFEILNYATYAQPQVLFGTMGFGQPLDATPILLQPGMLTLAWGSVVEMIATAAGVELDEIRQTHERVAADSAFDIACGRVEAGTTAGLRFEVQGIVKGRPAIVVEHVTRLHDDVAPGWPRAAHPQGGYRIEIEGTPRVSCDLHLEGPDGDHNTGGLIVSAMRTVNAIPAVCAAEPGLLSTLDLPAVTIRGVLR